MLKFWGLKWTIEASDGQKYLKCLKTKVGASCQEPCKLFVLTQPFPAFHSPLKLFFSVLLGCVYSRLLPPLPGSPGCDGQHKALSLVTEVVMW